MGYLKLISKLSKVGYGICEDYFKHNIKSTCEASQGIFKEYLMDYLGLGLDWVYIRGYIGVI